MLTKAERGMVYLFYGLVVLPMVAVGAATIVSWVLARV